jgi:hypothetical protein
MWFWAQKKDNLLDYFKIGMSCGFLFAEEEGHLEL